MGHHRVVLVGLDALEGAWLRRLTARGDLPNLGAFLRRTGEAAVRSDGNLLHGSIWPTFASGMGPGHHGRYWWLQWLAEEMRYVRSSHPAFAYEPFWRGLAEAGRRVAVVDIPYAPLVPHELVEQVTGWGSHDEVEPESWPADALMRVRRDFGNHPLSFDTVEPQSPSDLTRMAESLARGVAMRTRLLERLAKDQSVDLAIVIFGETHKAGHYLAEEREVRPGVTSLDLIARVLAPLDAGWPDILAAAGAETTVVLFALHGMQHQVDFSTLGRPVLALAQGRDPSGALPRPDFLRRVRDAVPDPVHRFIWQRLPARVRAARQGTLDGQGAHPGHDAAFPIGHDGDFAFRLSIVGRESPGAVAREAAGEWFDRIERAAAEFRTVGGDQIFVDLVRNWEQYPGPRLDRLPDGLLLGNRALTRVREAVDGAGRHYRDPKTEARDGIHTGRGFCFVRPAAGARLELPAEIDARDFAPSLYALLGVAPPIGLQGKAFAAEPEA